jgi:demethylmenaquinone methyltransferase/2-methoxy-6-polyprenyl-1,4-benzoquinol methylase
VVLDLCTGNGVSLPGLRQPGRTVLGMDVSLRMLELAQAEHGGPGWAPRLVCADGFRIPARKGSVDAVTIAFGIRNLRPRLQALAELARVLRPGGTLVVLEATAPGRGPLAAFHRLHLRHGVPLLGRLSPDPSAYHYLSRSIFEFGSGDSFEADLRAAGFEVTRRRSFLLGATHLWQACLDPGREAVASDGAPGLQAATGAGGFPHKIPADLADTDREWKAWTGLQLLLSLALTAVLAWGALVFAGDARTVPMAAWQRVAGWMLIVVGLAIFSVRTVLLAMRLLGGRQPR